LSTTQVAIENAIKAVNGVETTKVVKAAATTGTNAQFVAALKDAAFTGYDSANDAANDAAYWAAKTSFNAVTTVAQVDAAIAQVNVDVVAAAITAPTYSIATSGTTTPVLPTVPTGYTIAVKTSATPAAYAADGKLVAAGTSAVVYTVTHTASTKTADSVSVTVTVTP